MSDALSPTAWVLEVYEMVFGFNPLDETLQWFTGDWQAFARCAEAWKNLGSMCDDIAANIQGGNRELDASWQGHAADMAYLYFDTLQQKTVNYNSSLTKLSGEYREIAHAVFSAAEAAKGVLAALADDVIITAVLLAEGTAFSWTGVGAAVGYGVASIHIARMLKHWGQITETLSRTQNTVNASVGIIQGLSATLASQLMTFPVPGTAYDHPAVPTRS
ncbi:hypothetical protein [Streptomyces daliensis]|uniref:Proteins of 100 residues with WXG n=1 Tax=Streptomyces daliensis TaxID=299421 RepID=A0A8T4IYL5_9ACTN|nr:hypothetical protein [Streptomyces daliensis]